MVKKHGGNKPKVNPQPGEIDPPDLNCFQSDDPQPVGGSDQAFDQRPPPPAATVTFLDEEGNDDGDAVDSSTIHPPVAYPLSVDYCGVCTMPIEYCPYSPTYEQCRRWLEKNLPDAFGRLSLGAPGLRPTAGLAVPGICSAAGLAELEASGQMAAHFIRESLLEGVPGGAKRQTRGGKGSNLASKVGSGASATRSKLSSVRVFTAPRGKKKAVTVVTGLQEFGVDLKAASKFFASKFSCGASVTGDDEIVIQGDVKDDIIDMVPEKWPDIPGSCVKDLGTMKR